MSSYISNNHAQVSPLDRHSWDEFTFARLLWRYGHKRALNIIDGHDAATIADLAAWRRLGSSAARQREDAR